MPGRLFDVRRDRAILVGLLIPAGLVDAGIDSGRSRVLLDCNLHHSDAR